MVKPVKIMFWRIFNGTEKWTQYNFKRKKSVYKTQVPRLFFKNYESVYVCVVCVSLEKKEEI